MKNSCGFIFDMDGTLVDSMPYHTLSWQQLLGELGVKMTGEEIERRNHGILPEVIRNLLGDQLSQSEVAYVATNGTGILEQPLLIPADLNKDDQIDFSDFAVLADQWLDNKRWP